MPGETSFLHLVLKAQSYRHAYVQQRRNPNKLTDALLNAARIKLENILCNRKPSRDAVEETFAEACFHVLQLVNDSAVNTEDRDIKEYLAEFDSIAADARVLADQDPLPLEPWIENCVIRIGGKILRFRGKS